MVHSDFPYLPIPSHLPSVLVKPPPKIKTKFKTKLPNQIKPNKTTNNNKKVKDLVVEAVVWPLSHTVYPLFYLSFLQVFIVSSYWSGLRTLVSAAPSIMGLSGASLGYPVVLCCCEDPAVLDL